jgi:hypothetical protein
MADAARVPVLPNSLWYLEQRNFSLLLRLSEKAPTKAIKKIALGQLVNCQLSLFSGSFEIRYSPGTVTWPRFPE